MSEIYPVQGKDLPDLQEPWRWKRAGCTIVTGIIGGILAFGSAQGMQNIPAAPVRILGGLLMVLAIAALIVTRFCTRYVTLGPGGKTLSWFAALPGGAVLFIWWYMLYVFYYIIIAVFTG